MSLRLFSRQLLSAGKRVRWRDTSKSLMPHVVGNRQEEEEEVHVVQNRGIHSTARRESTMILIAGLGAAATFTALHYANEGIQVIQEKRAKGEPIFARSKSVIHND